VMREAVVVHVIAVAIAPMMRGIAGVTIDITVIVGVRFVKF